eukprot:7388847-Prymnesium_polylepis.1
MDGACGAIAPATQHTDSRIRTEEQRLALRRTDQPARLTRQRRDLAVPWSPRPSCIHSALPEDRHEGCRRRGNNYQPRPDRSWSLCPVVHTARHVDIVCGVAARRQLSSLSVSASASGFALSLPLLAAAATRRTRRSSRPPRALQAAAPAAATRGARQLSLLRQSTTLRQGSCDGAR